MQRELLLDELGHPKGTGLLLLLGNGMVPPTSSPHIGL